MLTSEDFDRTKYGTTRKEARRLAKDFGITEKLAKQWLGWYPGINKFIDCTKEARIESRLIGKSKIRKHELDSLREQRSQEQTVVLASIRRKLEEGDETCTESPKTELGKEIQFRVSSAVYENEIQRNMKKSLVILNESEGIKVSITNSKGETFPIEEVKEFEVITEKNHVPHELVEKAIELTSKKSSSINTGWESNYELDNFDPIKQTLEHIENHPPFSGIIETISDPCISITVPEYKVSNIDSSIKEGADNDLNSTLAKPVFFGPGKIKVEDSELKVTQPSHTINVEGTNKFLEECKRKARAVVKLVYPDGSLPDLPEIIKEKEAKKNSFSANPFLESPIEKCDTSFTIDGDCLIIFDLHCPQHDSLLLHKAMLLGQKYGIKNTLFGGDMLASEQLHLKYVTETRRKYQEDIVLLSDILSVIKTNFKQDIYGIIGNHDDIIIKYMRKEFDADWFYSKLLGGIINMGGKEWCYVKSGGVTFQVEHGASYSASNPLSVAQKLSSKFHYPILMGHQHVSNVGYDTSGTMQCICSGGMFDPARIAYCNEKHNTSPAMQQGFVIVKDGFASHYTPKSPEILALG